ncbi:MAG: hypothetical protein AAGD14_16480 [Planctomycetota bacterium]
MAPSNRHHSRHTSRRARATTRGFTVLEVSLAVGILATIVGTTAIGIAADTRVERVLTQGLGPQMTAQDALQRIRAELRVASIAGEDVNGNGTLEPEEDLNDDGRLTADWSLADEVADQPSLTFNRRQDKIDANGEVTALGRVSAPISYRLESNKLVRTDAGEASVIARNVSSLRFSRSGKLVTITIDVGSGPDAQTLTTRVWVRN